VTHDHVHIGAGKFGLGMVVDLCHRAGFRTLVMNRKSGAEHHHPLGSRGAFRVVYDNAAHQELKKVTAHFYDSALETEAIELIANSSVRLLTTSVRPDGLRDVAPLIAEALARRVQNHVGTPLCILACENLRDNSAQLSDHVKAHFQKITSKPLGGSAVFCNTIVDRICAGIAVVGGLLEVSVEEFSEWIIEHPGRSIDALDTLSGLDGVTLTRSNEEFQAFETRKYWCLNGVQLAAAAYSYHYDPGLVLLSEALENQNILGKVRALQDEVGYAFRLYAGNLGVSASFPEEEVVRYSDSVLRRFRRNKTDRVSRLLKHQEDAESRLRQFIQSIVEAAAATVESQAGGEKAGSIIRQTLRQNLLKTLSLMDIHEFLNRFVERVVGPWKEILNSDKEDGLQFKEEFPREGLQLDDALETILVATQRYTQRVYESLTSETPKLLGFQ
jgi:mannitol-1-phosphate/altronate dehydrogenase